MMASPIGRLDVKDLVFRGISLSITAAIVLVFLGPAVDHHFAERQHNHSHIYLTISAAEHGHTESHPFEEPHIHSSTETGVDAHHGIIYLTSNDGLSDSGTGSGIAFITDPFPQIHGDYYSPNAQTASGSIICKAFVTPPKKPPLA